MSWDIIVQDLPEGIESVDELGDDYEPVLIGRRSEIISKIKEVVPMSDFGDPSWGVIECDGFSVEVSMGDDEECKWFCLHIRGGGEAVGMVADILEKLDLQAIDPQSDSGIFNREEAKESLKRWRDYRDKVMGDQ